MREGNRFSPGAISGNSMPNSILRGRPLTPSPTNPWPMAVRLKPGRSAGTPPAKVSDGLPPLPARSPQLEDRFQGRLSPRLPPSPNAGSGTGLNPGASAKPVPPPRSRSADSVRLPTDPQPRIAAGDRPTPPPRSRSADSVRLATDPQSRIAGDGRPPLPPRPAIAPQATGPGAGPMLVFHRKNPAGPPITGRVESLPRPLPPKPPGNDEPLR
jgi:hypothetical protein